MKISRENYEIWFTDWLEGKLSGEELGELKIFLGENPDLKKEFYDHSEFSLDPPAENFHWKGLLKRDPSEIPSDQFDLLCAAKFENDLDSDQLSEFSEIIASDSGKKRIAELFALTKIIPPAEKYPFRKNLYRRTLSGTLVRFALPAVSAAAILALLLMSGVLRKRIMPVPGNIANIAEARSFNAPAPPAVVTHNYSSISVKSNTAKTGKLVPSETRNEQSTGTAENTSGTNIGPVEILPVEVIPVLQPESFKSSLADGPSYLQPQAEEDDEERSRIGKFLARTFREKVLDESTASDKPLKGYEIAEAGITGINKLLGWEMALTRNTDDDGKTSSVNFNSRLLKFNAPVKNNETGE